MRPRSFIPPATNWFCGALILAFAVVGGCSSSNRLVLPGEARVQPVASGYAEDRLIDQGLLMHEIGNFEGAAASYQRVLESNPDNARALYRLSLTYFSMGLHEQGLAAARKASRYESPYLPGNYAAMGNHLDRQGRADEAVSVFRQALEEFPKAYLLHFNLGVTLVNNRQYADAAASLEMALALAPQHSSSHYALGVSYLFQGRRVPSLLALSRFLLMEGDTDRSREAVRYIRTNLAKASGRNAETEKVVFELSDHAKQAQGDFAPAELIISLAAVAATTEAHAPDAELSSISMQYSSLIPVLAESASDRTGFVWDHYVPFFVALDEAGHTDTFARFILRSGDLPGVHDWLAANRRQVDAFLTWSDTHSR